MGDLKRHQPPMTIDEQIENLKEIGLIVEDEEHAKKILKKLRKAAFRKMRLLSIKVRICGLLRGCGS